jgi:branched-chain amino acid transport system ATP-binding protein
MALLEVRDVTKRFGGLTALEGVNIVIEEGQIFGLIGPNGAGKTTLFNLITGI